MGHANDEVGNKAACQTDEKREIRHTYSKQKISLHTEYSRPKVEHIYSLHYF